MSREHQPHSSGIFPESPRSLFWTALGSSTGKVFWDLLGRSLGFVLSVLVARSLGAAGYGQYAVIWYLAWMTTQITDLGLHLVSLRYMSRESDGESGSDSLGKAIALKSLLTVFTFTGYAVVARAVASSETQLSTALLFYTATLVGSWAELFGVALRSRRRLALEGIVLAVLRGGWVAGAWGVLWHGGGIREIGVGLALAGLPALVLGWVFAQKYARPRWEAVRRGFWRDLARQTAPLAVTSIITLAYLRLDVLVLAHLRGAEAAGLFSASFRLFEALFVLSGGIVAGSFPLMAARAENRSLSPLAGYLTRFLLWVAAPAATFFAVLAEPIIALVYGEDYAGSVLPLRFLGAAIVAVYTNALTTHLLVAAGRSHALVAVMLVRLGVGLGLDLLLIPFWGVSGAAMAVVGAEWSLTVVSLLSVRDTLAPPYVFKTLALPLAGALAMTGAVSLLPAPLLARVAFGAALYVSGSLLAWRLSARTGATVKRLRRSLWAPRDPLRKVV